MTLSFCRIVASALTIAAVLVFPALAAAADFEVNSTGDEVTTVACETGAGVCTLRGAIAAANLGSSKDEITFAPSFAGGAGSTIALGSALSISQPVEIKSSVIDEPGGSVPAATVQVSGTAITISGSGAGTVVEGLGIKATSIGIQVLGAIGTQIRANFISGAQAGIEVGSGGGSTGNVIEGNKILVPANFNWGIAIQYGANKIFGNQIEGGGCCYQGIYVEQGGAGNQIGGDTPASENVITDFWYGAIWINTSNHNEIGRNRGTATQSGFIRAPSAVAAPTISTAFPTKVTGSAEPGATVRIFATANEGTGQIDGFLGETKAEPSGRWTATIASSAVGAHLSATQTFEGGTSELAATTTVESEPPAGGGETGGGSGGGEASGGSSGGGTSATVPPTVPPIAAPTPTKPTVTITRGPKKFSRSTSARFAFRASAAGATFECKLDGAKWATCRSPKTYRKLRVGTHTFRVRAAAGGSTGAVTKYQFKIKE